MIIFFLTYTFATACRSFRDVKFCLKNDNARWGRHLSMCAWSITKGQLITLKYINMQVKTPQSKPFSCRLLFETSTSQILHITTFQENHHHVLFSPQNSWRIISMINLDQWIPTAAAMDWRRAEPMKIINKWQNWVNIDWDMIFHITTFKENHHHVLFSP